MDYLQYPRLPLDRFLWLSLSFKPYYKWITFNTKTYLSGKLLTYSALVLNLIINGLPSILLYLLYIQLGYLGFKPYYKWITFNTDIW